MEDPENSHVPSWPASLGRIALRICVIVAVAVAASWLISYGMTLSEHLPEAGQGAAQGAIIAVALLVYIALIAVPFVPGLEIGVALMIVRGVSIAPAVYVATALGLLLAYSIGRRVPVTALERLFRDLRMGRAAEMLARGGPMSMAERLEAMQTALPPWLATPATRYRYLMLALLINMPGSAIYGGGGGLLMAAGISRLFEPLKTIPTVFVAVLPLPISFWLFGPMLLG